MAVDDILKKLLNRSLLLKIGQETIAIIQKRTLQGDFLPGSSENAKHYSTRPAPMPLGGLYQRLGKGKGSQVWKRIQRGEEPGTIWKQSSSGKIWLILQGGYKRLRELSGRETDHVNLNWTGHMMRSLSLIIVNETDHSVTIQFSNYDAAQLASYHHEGVGRNKVKRLFLGLTSAELQKLSNGIAKHIQTQF